MSKFTAAQLVEFYQAVADGGVVQMYCAITDVWFEPNPTILGSPFVHYYSQNWRNIDE